ncbi:MAG: hypothetical protein OEZ10_07975 [Gammaproteobacteria bacterium]|nr:hypothetical protein [Gammaproteobacteria bacterium]
MKLRFRLGPFTFGSGGTRLSIWSGGTGVSIPLSKKGRSFGKVGIGNASAYFNDSSSKNVSKQRSQEEIEELLSKFSSDERVAIAALGSDEEFIYRIQRYGVPWRGVQERLKEELPDGLPNRDDMAYRLVPKAMDTVFGMQNSAWKTEKREAKSGKGFTTWIIVNEVPNWSE